MKRVIFFVSIFLFVFFVNVFAETKLPGLVDKTTNYDLVVEYNSTITSQIKSVRIIDLVSFGTQSFLVLEPSAKGDELFVNVNAVKLIIPSVSTVQTKLIGLEK